jgi:hypothetical protein
MSRSKKVIEQAILVLVTNLSAEAVWGHNPIHLAEEKTKKPTKYVYCI